MQINTKFNIGDSVVFLSHNCFKRRTISRLEIEASAQDDKTSVLIKYYFSQHEPEFNTYEPDYKYEEEVAATKEDLAKNAKEC